MKTRIFFAAILITILSATIFAQDKAFDRTKAKEQPKTEIAAPDSTVYKYLVSEYNKQNKIVTQKEQDIIQNYAYIPVIADLKANVEALQKIIIMIQEEQRRLNSKNPPQK